MFLRLFLIFLLPSVIYCSSAQAYLIASEPEVIKAGVPTDVFVAGFGGDQGDQFLRSAILAAKVSRDRFPQRQRVIISAVSVSLAAESQLLIAAGFGFRKKDDDELVKNRLLLAIQYLKSPVTSLQFFGHANTYNGFRLQSKSSRLSEEDQEFKDLGAVLAPQAFAIFYSCNSGWKLAQAAAELWGKPVFGSFASSDFQEPMSDGQWYYHDEGYFPENLTRIGPTSMIIRESLDCRKGRCLRLKSANSPYVDDFGAFEKGLGFYKVFAKNADQLPGALIHYTLLVPSVQPLSVQSSRQDFIKVISDWMCPSDKSGKKRSDCTQAIQNEEFKNNAYLSYFSGKPVSCSNTTCQTKVKCKPWKAILGLVPCETYDVSARPSTDFSDQLNLIFKGLDQLEQGLLNFNP